MKKTRTKLGTLAGARTLRDLDPSQLDGVVGSVKRPTKICTTPPRDPDDVFRIDDE